jgi:hypothetical protein
MTTLTRSLALSILAIAAPLSALAQDAKTTDDRRETAEGVIVKVEAVEAPESKEVLAGRVKITVNTAAVWSDYVRDQASTKPRESAKDGANSVAAKGQPVSPSTVVVGEVGARANLSMRFRSSTDETNKGSRTVEGAEKKDGTPASEDVKRRIRDQKAPKVTIGDLKVGQFVELESKDGMVTRLIVLKPIGGPETPASEAKPTK